MGIGFGKRARTQFAVACAHCAALQNGSVRYCWELPANLLWEHVVGARLEERLPPSLACACWGVENGARIIRCHDVAATRHAVRMTEALMQQQTMPNILHTSHEGWRPAVEIAILSVGIYYSFNFVRGTRGAPVVYGFMLLVLGLTVVALLLKPGGAQLAPPLVRRVRRRRGPDHFSAGIAPHPGRIGHAPHFRHQPRAAGKHRGHHPDRANAFPRCASAPSSPSSNRSTLQEATESGPAGGLRGHAGNAGNHFLSQQRHS